MCRMSLLVFVIASCIATVLAAPYPKELLGTWVGTCSEYAYVAGNETVCTGSHKILVSYPYMIKWFARGGKLMSLWAQYQSIQAIPNKNGNLFNYSSAAFEITTPNVAKYGDADKGQGSCVTSYDPDGTPYASLIHIERQPSGRWAYYEAGKGGGSSTSCLPYQAALYCRGKQYSYECINYKI